MTLLALEIHDAGILVKREGAVEAGVDSPGYALVDGDRIIAGKAARSAARLQPQRVDSRFWSELGTADLPLPFAPGISRADLAHAHLESVWTASGEGVDAAILAVPGSYTDERLGLLLGIARACGVPVTGLVDSAVASAPVTLPDSHVLHLDLQLHRAVVSELIPGAELSRRELRIAADVGLVALQDAWVRRIAEHFVRETRFDPLHVGRSEQALYDSLPGILRRLEDAERDRVELQSGAERHTVEISRRELAAAVDDHVGAIARLVGTLARSGRRATILMSHRCARLPGLAERLESLGDTESIRLPRDAALDGALRNRRAICGDGAAFCFVTQLPMDEPVVTVAPDEGGTTRAPVAKREGIPPTHVVYRGTAHPIAAAPLVLGVSVRRGTRAITFPSGSAGISREHCTLSLRDDHAVLEDHSRHGSFLNGRRVRGAVTVACGDTLRVGSPGIELLLIRAVGEDGSSRD